MKILIGKALLGSKSFEEAINHLSTANDLAKKQNLNFGDEITQILRIAKKGRWDVQGHLVAQKMT